MEKKKLFCFTYCYNSFKDVYIRADSEKEARDLLEADMGNAFKQVESANYDEEELDVQEIKEVE